MRLRSLPVLLSLGLAATGCGSARPDKATRGPTPTEHAAALDGRPADTSDGGVVPDADTPTGPAWSTITDPVLLARLEQRGLALGTVLGAGTDAHASTQQLAEHAAWQSVSATLLAELSAIASADPAAGVSVARFSHRLFDSSFLRSKNSQFALMAITERLDRRPFAPEGCGEVRLLYRLRYTSPTRGLVSSLPVTLALEFHTPQDAGGGCQAAARRWLVPAGVEPTDPAAADYLLGPSGPLSSPALAPDRLLQLVVNLQSVRWPSAVRPDLGGHAEYILRAFRRDVASPRFVEAPLENTPDVARLQTNPSLRRELLDWLRQDETRAEVERGSARLPERFLARRALSVTPRGLARLENRPFRRLFSPQDLGEQAFAGPRVRSAEGYLRRLDELSCGGCHQSRSIAGFHMLGQDAADAPAGTALEVPFSPHVSAELERRSALARAWRGSQTPDETVPFAERGESVGVYGSACGLGDATFRDWTCGPGLSCVPYDAPERDAELVGTCLPVEPEVGDPCEYGPLDARSDSHRDRATHVTRHDCAASMVCNRNAVGFPGGLCTAACSAHAPHVHCGAIAILDPFNACLAHGEPFTDCVAKHTRPSGLRACSLAEPCRDDYACARAAGGGVCSPPYFLFQLRVDGHTP